MAHAISQYWEGDRLSGVRRFLTVGLVSTLLDVGIFSALRFQLGLPALEANTLSYSAGIVNAFVLHRQWTFSQRPRKGVRGQFVQFALASLAAFVLNTLLVLVLAPQFRVWVGLPTAGDLMAKLCATGVGMCWNFVINNFYVFRATAEGASQGSL